MGALWYIGAARTTRQTTMRVPSIRVLVCILACCTLGCARSKSAGPSEQGVLMARGLWVLVVDQYSLEDPRSPQDYVNRGWAGGYSSTDYFKWLFGAGQLEESNCLALLAFDGVPTAASMSDLGPSNNAWCAIALRGDKIISESIPLFFTRNLLLTTDSLRKGERNDDIRMDAKATPFGDRLAVLVDLGGRTKVLLGPTVRLRDVLPRELSKADLEVLRP